MRGSTIAIRALLRRGRLLPLLLIAALTLAACGAGPLPPDATPTPAGNAPNPASPTSAPTQVPPTSAPTQVPPTSAPTQVPPTSAPTQAPPTSAPTAAPTAAPTQAPVSPAIGSEIFFLRSGALVAYAVASGQERQIAPQVREFAATPDGRRLALVRETGGSSEIWLIERDGSGLRQITRNSSVESGLSWAPDGMTLAYAAANSARRTPLDWQNWATWCNASEVRLLSVASGAETTLAPGCDPAFSPDGRRIAFATPPTATEAGGSVRNADNAIQLVNRQGQNSWNFATADTESAENGLLVYAPAWSPDSSQVAYQRFLGYRALVDICLTEIGGSFEGKGKLMGSGAGWMFPPIFAPDGQSVALVEHNYSDARGYSGYEIWQTQVLRLGVAGEVILPDGTYSTEAARTDRLFRATGAAWSPDGSALAVALPAGWSAATPPSDPVYANSAPGDLWRWTPGSPPGERLVTGVDFASPLAWLPALPQVAAAAGYRLAYPADWQLAAPTEFEELTARAADGLRLISAAPIPGGDPAGLTVADAFARFVAPGAREETPINWPDGSIYRGFTGAAPDGAAIAGALRTLRSADGTTIALLYRTTPQRWPLERASAQALLAASGAP